MKKNTRPPLGAELKKPMSIQNLLDKPDPEYDVNSPVSRARRAEYERNPAQDIRDYIKKKRGK